MLPVPLDQADIAQLALEAPLLETQSALPSLPVPNPTKSFWTHGTPNANPLASMGSTGALTTDADVCIIGSGITGISAAYHFTQAFEKDGGREGAALKTVVLEARDFCSGATGRNGGHLTPAAYSDFRRRATAFGAHEATKCLAIEKYNVDEIIAIIRQHGLKEAVDLVSGGHATLLFSPLEREAARADVAAAEAAGVDTRALGLQWSDEEVMRKEFGTDYAAYRWQGHNLWPLKLVTELFNIANASAAHDLHLHTHTPVNSVTPIDPAVADANTSSTSASRRWNVNTPRGTVSCSYVLHATNGYAAHLLPHMHGPEGIIPVRGQVIATRASVTAEHFVNASYGGNEGFEYWFPRPVKNVDEKPLILLGGKRETSGPGFELYKTDDSKVNVPVGRALRKFLPRVFPTKFEKAEAEMEWTGIMGYTKLADPFVGPVILRNGSTLEGQFIAAGYSGHGMPRAFACAEAVAGMITSDIQSSQWVAPEWLPEHYLTWKRPI